MKKLIAIAAALLAMTAAGTGVLAADAAAAHYKVVFQVSDNDPAKWNLALNNIRNLQQDLGRENVESRLERFVGAYARTIGALQRRINYVDLRYSNGFAVRIQELRGEPRENVRGTAARSPVKPEKKG